ncbi:MAG: HNH endonuclease [Janthinobacterium lividum]
MSRPDICMWLNVGEYMAGTMPLTAEAHGAHMLLMMCFTSDGPLPVEDRHLATITKMTTKRFRQIGVRRLLEPYETGLAPTLILKMREIDRRERAARRILDVSPGIWAELRAAVFARDGYRCTYCGCADQKLECDHIIAFSSGGSSDMSNLTTACGPCNRSKGARLLSEWAR